MPVKVEGLAAGRQGLCHGRGGRCRHPQPHRLQAAGAGELLLRPEAPLGRAARPLRPAHRRHAGRARARIRTGGDGGGGELRHRRRRRRRSRCSPASSPVGADGTAEVAFDIPAFNGTVRVMAVAWTPTKVGHASSRRHRARSGRDRRHAAALPARSATSRASASTSSMPRRRPATTRSPSRSTARSTCSAGRALPDGASSARPARARRSTSRSPRPASATRRLTRHARRPGRRRHRPELSRSASQPGNPPVTRRTVDDARGQWRRDHGRSDLLAEMVPGTGARLALGRAAAGSRRAGASEGARPLSLWLLRAARQPRAAAALPQRARRRRELGLDDERRRAPRATRSQRVLARQDSSGALRPVGSATATTSGYVLCHRLPAAGPREGLCRAGARR